ncbi:hypothetical protein AB0O82_10620 [Kitasatospora sp. NPDC088264]|uniref:hypothetical protein n=1 Tax=Kitasatospora sp. NPDC088264 TaxID=3155296 RepID=UPI00341C424B
MSVIRIPRRYLVEVVTINCPCGTCEQASLPDPLPLSEAAAELVRTAYELATPGGVVSLAMRDGLPVATCSFDGSTIILEVRLRVTSGPAQIALLPF